jgi:hypothetical protein
MWTKHGKPIIFPGFFFVFGPPLLWFASPIFMLIAYYFGFTNRKRKDIEEKTTATLKSKQTSFATVRKHILTAVSLPTPLIFRYPLLLRHIFTRIDEASR